MRKNIGLKRIDGHRSHISGKRSVKFLQRIKFQEYQDEKLKVWFKKYKDAHSR